MLFTLMSKNKNSTKDQFNSFSRGKLNLEQDLNILYQYDHAVSGAKLIMAETKAVYGAGEDKSPRYILAWVGAEAEDVEIYRYFKDKKKAFSQYSLSTAKQPPVREDINHDWQQQRVYDWEEEQFGEIASRMDPETMQRAANRIADEFNIEAMDISFKKAHGNSNFEMNYYYFGNHTVTLQSNDIETLLHEISHAIDHKANHNKWAHHGPSFVRTLITLLDKYLFLDPDKLTKSAEEAGITVAERRDLPNLPKP